MSEQAAGPVLDKAYEILLDALGFEPASVDVLVERTGFRADEVASMLLILELDGALDPAPAGVTSGASSRQRNEGKRSRYPDLPFEIFDAEVGDVAEPDRDTLKGNLNGPASPTRSGPRSGMALSSCAPI